MEKVDVCATYLGAHSVPKEEHTMESYTENIIKEQIPEIAKQMKENKISPEFVDVFHEKAIFENEQTEKVIFLIIFCPLFIFFFEKCHYFFQILLAGKSIGLKINYHGDELAPEMHSAELAVKLGANCYCHCERVSEEGIKKLSEYAEKNKQHPCVAVLLPTTAYLMR